MSGMNPSRAAEESRDQIAAAHRRKMALGRSMEGDPNAMEAYDLVRQFPPAHPQCESAAMPTGYRSDSTDS